MKDQERLSERDLMPTRESILALLKEEPHDPFLLYSLAMEDLKEGNSDGALAGFEEIQRLDPTHVASYQQQGQVLMGLERYQEADNALVKGIQQANAQGNAHASAEMQGLRDLLP